MNVEALFVWTDENLYGAAAEGETDIGVRQLHSNRSSQVERTGPSYELADCRHCPRFEP